MNSPPESFHSLRLSTPKLEGKMQVSKWLQCQVLLEENEMKALFEILGEFQIFSVGRIVEKSKAQIEKLEFIECYASYVQEIKSGRLPKDELFRSFFGCIFTTSTNVLYAMEIDKKREIIHPTRPVLQLQAHSLAYSPEDGKFRPMILGETSILWGIQFSYPQLFQDNKTLQVEKVDESEAFPNSQIFRKLQRWVRHNTKATPFIVGGKKINVPMRLGKECFEWINNHPQLIKKEIKVFI
jgi:hypothetical protein